METVLKITREVYRVLGDNMVLIIFAIAGFAMIGIARGEEMPSTQLLNCVADERAEWSVIGSADFVGEPWFNEGTTVPGERLMVHFDDQTLFSYGGSSNGTDHDIWAKNLTELQVIGMDNMPPPYTAVKRSDDAIILLKTKVDGTCSVGWYLGEF